MNFSINPCGSEMVNLKNLQDPNLTTPAFVFYEKGLKDKCNFLCNLTAESSSQFIYPLKTSSVFAAVNIISEFTNGFAASSAFEVRLASELIKTGTIHFTSPGIFSQDFNIITKICDYIKFNSISQMNFFKDRIPKSKFWGLRINPGLSLVKDKRYDPCRPFSKLGVPVTDLWTLLYHEPDALNGMSGLQFHSNCDADSVDGLLNTVRLIEQKLSHLLHKIEWINLGGGYLFDKIQDLSPFYEAVALLKSRYDLDVFIEPGSALLRDNCYLVSSVVDLFFNNGKQIAILDTSVNHLPEVFEYQYQPDIDNSVTNGTYEYILAGCTCLSGDLFGEYSFDSPLEIGSNVVFSNVGAYSIVKAHMFNGVNLPSIYLYTEAGELVLKKQYTYEDFANRCGININAIV